MRYVFLAAISELCVAGETLRQEVWLGVESESRIDLQKFSEEHKVMLIPCYLFTADQFRSIGVTKFERLDA